MTLHICNGILVLVSRILYWYQTLKAMAAQWEEQLFSFKHPKKDREIHYFP